MLWLWNSLPKKPHPGHTAAGARTRASLLRNKYADPPRRINCEIHLLIHAAMPALNSFFSLIYFMTYSAAHSCRRRVRSRYNQRKRRNMAEELLLAHDSSLTGAFALDLSRYALRYFLVTHKMTARKVKFCSKALVARPHTHEARSGYFLQQR